MDLLDLLKLMFRRWYVSAPVVVVTLGAALAFGLAIQPEYKTEVAILLVPPTTSAAAPAPNATPRPGNPWLRIGENAMAQAVQISTSAHDARKRIAAAGGDPDYEVGLVTRSSILTVAVTAATEESARKTVEAITQLIHDEVAGQQAQYRPNPGEQITTEVLDPGLNIVQSRSNVLRAQVVIAAIGALLAAVAAVVWDAVARRRASARLGQRRDGPNPMAWNAGQAPVGPPPRPAPAGAPAPVARSAPVSGGPGREATQPLSRVAAGVHPPDDRRPRYPADDRYAGADDHYRRPGTDDQHAGPAVEDRYPDDRYAGSVGNERTGGHLPHDRAAGQGGNGRAAAQPGEETILLTSTARNVLDDPGR
ncbi:hypothetical protein [Plantactinospora endophytica]|uniref:Polysaccharide chain length determinant N-terminal domain-containing protein n=1 Tax=Plantactinospora endophytica TaxID=673535 RepID=A0ABQ4E3N2_9ACTN|nr:hypothetical protein [Plantactinospora endophytica]GIG89316.1 hypothetical protein Pen02_42520 [Plantactinospora endophytica]